MNIGSYELMSGSSAYFTCPDNPAYALGASDFTIEAWIKSFEGGPILGKQVSGRAGFCLSVDLGSVTLSTKSSSGQYATLTVNNIGVCDGTWHHVAGVRAGSQLHIFVDGTALSGTMTTSGTPPLSISSSDRLTIGAVDDSAVPKQFFAGELAEIRLWKEARKLEDVNHLMGRRIKAGNLSANLIGYWPGEYGIASDFSITHNDTSSVGMPMMSGSQPPLTVTQPDMTFLFSGIYDTWSRDLQPEGSWTSLKQFSLTSGGFVLMDNIVLQNTSIKGTIIQWLAQSDLPGMSLSFFDTGSDPNFWDLPQKRSVIQGFVPGSPKMTIIKGLFRPMRVGCGLLLNVGTSRILANRSGKPVLVDKSASSHDHVCEYENGGILEMSSNLAIQAAAARPGVAVSFETPALSSLEQAWTFQPDGTVALTSNPTVGLSAGADRITVTTALSDSSDDRQKWLGLSDSQRIYNGQSQTSVISVSDSGNVRVVTNSDGTSKHLWYTFRSSLISESNALALTVTGAPQNARAGTALIIDVWHPGNTQQQFVLNGSVYVHIDSNLMLSVREDGAVVLADILDNPPPTAKWSLGQPVAQANITASVTDIEGLAFAKASNPFDVEYVVTIETGDYIAAGTDDSVDISLTSGSKSLPFQRLSNSELHADPFERGCMDIFRFRAPDIGPIRGFTIKYGADTWFYRGRWVVNSISVTASAYRGQIAQWNSLNRENLLFVMPALYSGRFTIFDISGKDTMSMCMAPAQDAIGGYFGWYHTWIEVTNPGKPVVKTYFDCAGGHGGEGTIDNVITGSCSREDAVLMSTGFPIDAIHPLQATYGTNRTDGYQNAGVRADGKLKWDGQCHQMANRYLWVCNPRISIDDAFQKPYGYQLSVWAFGKYGVGFTDWLRNCGFKDIPAETSDNIYTWIQTAIPAVNVARSVFAAALAFQSLFSKTSTPDPDGPEVKDLLGKMRSGGATIPQIAKATNLTEDAVKKLLPK
ncbi:Concanavalin A-like lectins/glucanase [Glarea lozoyensis ATCC 20868]|uniref:Concanavalin A-like lectins/glucanase n=1 Tax=Glarea lozoyensis (strain ATCC 20868 / MF5171) TaxID=1116229 RepID=S3D6L8_GLAL2|nr:Concanavalin A-like lectins/glucanase [Glarea lozoyensis ATCC 20868]EPE32759.1 Concanavalin A-like lectins/glucanase [Glarea lozoyensis ATCC 20868]